MLQNAVNIDFEMPISQYLDKQIFLEISDVFSLIDICGLLG